MKSRHSATCKVAAAAVAVVCSCRLALAGSSSFGTIYSFGASGNGQTPAGSLIASGPNLFGLTTVGGASGDGAIYQYNTSTNTETRLYSFKGAFVNPVDPDNHYGYGPLIQSGTTLYGVTNEGGSQDTGTLFSYNLGASSDAILHSFISNGTDGIYPLGQLLQNGNLFYGATTAGGSKSDGILFSVNQSNDSETILHTFAGGTGDGSTPTGGVTQVGSLYYGMTRSGGANGAGTIYSLNPSTKAYNVVYSFGNGTNDGTSPYEGGLLVSGSLLYGMTDSGGANDLGTIFQYNTSSGAEQVLYSFTSGNDGENPLDSTLIQSGPYLYGQTSQGGPGGLGAVFGFNTQSGTLSVLGDFTVGQPVGGLTLVGSTLYGVTVNGGTNSDGTIFSLPLISVPEPTVGCALLVVGIGMMRSGRLGRRKAGEKLGG